MARKKQEIILENVVIEAVAAEGDSLGGVLETVAIGLPKGVGEPWFDTVEGMLSHGIFSIPAVKGIEFGALLLTAKAKVRLLPPLNISFEDLEKAVGIIKNALREEI